MIIPVTQHKQPVVCFSLWSFKHLPKSFTKQNKAMLTLVDNNGFYTQVGEVGYLVEPMKLWTITKG